MWVHDPDSLRFLEVNDAAVRQYGWSRSQLLSMTVLDMLPPEDRPAFLQALLDGAAAGPALHRHRTRDGAVLTVEVRSNAVRGWPAGGGP